MKRYLLLLLFVILILAACSAQPAGPQSLTVMTHDSFAVSDEVLAAFEAENNVAVTFIRSGDTGSAVNAAVLAAGKPIADVFYGVDNTFLSRALEGKIFEAYDSPLLAEIPDGFKLDPENRALPVDFGDVCLNYDLAYFEEHDLPVPTHLDDLRRPEYAGLLAVPNPASSSPGLAFLFVTLGFYGGEGYLEYWQDLADNGVKVVGDWTTVYYTEFSRWGGEYPIVVSYGSSPPFEVLDSDPPPDTPPTGVLASHMSCYRQIEFVGILKGTENRKLAEKWVDFMLSKNFQEDLPGQMYVFPVNPNAELDQVFQDHLVLAENPIILDPEMIAEYREEWISRWREVVLQ
jgi:thiamine transport system substrate-binding protein